MTPAPGVSAAAARGQPSSRTVGIDLSSAPARTAAVALEWEGGRVIVGVPASGLDDSTLLELFTAEAWIAIAAPFGWPREFVAALSAYERSGAWRRPGKLEFRYRATDRFVHDYVLSAAGERLWPLSVASDRVALTARRLAGLREAVAERSGLRFDRAGADRVVEGYPAAALALWGLRRGAHRVSEQADGVRRAAAVAAREAVLSALEESFGAVVWLPGAREACAAEVGAFEALLCGLIARAAAKGLTVPPPATELSRAGIEGWIHLPLPGTLPRLLEVDRAPSKHPFTKTPAPVAATDAGA